jgi:hypothetical protein
MASEDAFEDEDLNRSGGPMMWANRPWGGRLSIVNAC